MQSDPRVAEILAEDIIAQQTCGFTLCTNAPDWRVEKVMMYTTDDGQVELAGYRNIPINRVCDYHKKRRKTHLMIANKAWAHVLRSLEIENPGVVKQVHDEMRLRRFEITWKAL